MTPIFDKSTALICWFDGENLFDLNLDWVAFHRNGHVFSVASLTWLGSLNEGAFRDRNGKAIAWLDGSSPSSGLKPLTPLKPLKPLEPLKPLKPLNPLKPLQPLTPLGGWSALNWQQWVQGT
jgi:hypothetical protein